MKTGHHLTMTLACALAFTSAFTAVARADFSYTQTRKGGPSMPGAGGDQTTKHYLKGQKMKMDSGNSATIFDFDAQTVTHVDSQAKTYTVTPFSEMGKVLSQNDVSAKLDVKETGQKKVVNGFNASEVVMTITMDAGAGGGPIRQMQMEMDTWLSSEVPGAQEVRAFYQKNGEHFPWSAMAGAGNPSMQKAMADMQKKMSSLGGVAVMQVMKMKSPGNEQQNAQMAQARQRLEEMKKQGGQQAAMADQMLARMGGAMGGAGGSLFEITMESSAFSAAPIPDSVFAIPADYKKITK